jgi:outer membrane protein assembly factor BamD
MLSKKNAPGFILIVVAAMVLAACSSRIPEQNPTAEQRFRMGMNEYLDEDWFDTIQHFEVIRLQFPGSAVADSARYFTGMCRFHREEYLLASYEFSQIIVGGRAAGLSSDAQYMYAACYYELSPKPALDQSYTIKAIDALQTFIELYPSHPRVKEADERIAELRDRLAEKEYKTGILYRKMDNNASALIYFDSVIDKYYMTSYIDDAMAAKARILVRQKKTQEADKLIKTFVEKYPDSPYISEMRGLLSEQGK